MGFFGLGVFSVFQCHSFGEKGVSFIVLPGIDQVFLLSYIILLKKFLIDKEPPPRGSI